MQTESLEIINKSKSFLIIEHELHLQYDFKRIQKNKSSDFPEKVCA